MEKELKFYLFKKLLIFGTEGAGKTTMTSVLSENSFKEQEPSKNGK